MVQEGAPKLGWGEIRERRDAVLRRPGLRGVPLVDQLQIVDEDAEASRLVVAALVRAAERGFEVIPQLLLLGRIRREVGLGGLA